MRKNTYPDRYQMVHNFNIMDRTYAGDSPEERERKDLLRKAKYITVIDDEIHVGGECYGAEGTAYRDFLHLNSSETTTVFKLRNVNAEIGNNLLHFRKGHPLSNVDYDPCEPYREEYIKKYGGTLKDLEW